MVLLLAACHGNRADTAPTPVPPTAPTTLDRIAVINATGTVVRDTAITFAAADGRTIVLRHPAPDEAIFLIVHVPPAADSLHSRDSLHLTIHAAPSLYEFTVASPDRFPTGTTATFSYAIHFKTPPDIATKYPSPGRLDLIVAPAELMPGSKVVFVAATRPAADMMRFPLAHPGSYALAVMR